MERSREPGWNMDKLDLPSAGQGRPIDHRAMSAPQIENSIESQAVARQLVIDGQAISSLTFSKRRQGPQSELKVDIRAASPETKGVLVRRDLDKDALAVLLGQDNARRIVDSKQRGGTLDGTQLAPREPQERLPDIQRENASTKLHEAVGFDSGLTTGPDEPRKEHLDPKGAASGERPVAQESLPFTTQQVDLDRRAELALRQAQLKAGLVERFVQIDGEYRFRAEPAKVAFVDRGAKLTTQSASPTVARSMVDLAEAKGWSSLRVRGEEGFRRQVWIEATLRDVKVVGYEATQEDRAHLQREVAARQANSVELGTQREPVPAPVPAGSEASQKPASSRPAPEAQPSSGRGAADGQRQILAVLQAALVAQNVDQKTAVGVLRSAEERMAKMADAGQKLPRVRIYDRQAPREKPAKGQAPQEVRERSARGR